QLLTAPLRERLTDGMPAWGTCAGLILLGRDQDRTVATPDVLDVDVERNAYGRQVDSFEDDVSVTGVGDLRGVFIRAPVVRRCGPDVTTLARHRGVAVVVRQGRLLGSSFHPELTGDPRLHAYFAEQVCA